MQRREFVAVAGVVAAAVPNANAERGTRNGMLGHLFASDFDCRVIRPGALSLPEVFARRLERARATLKARGSTSSSRRPAPTTEYSPATTGGASG